ncbi:semialdehyde dehydrogenase family protein [Herbihabitans rhizosphaerae]|uniref:Semialdehyde dehydrogenase family protein n=1 Tax=Herbihabitans rhizosphaerae TaxID=1872711 RepID=A0A4Q7L793_9PSEU|nr:epimerase [Herbihabitans rhizosphaerae]RZS44212.1 semialdehyde dehydrogenase family protein [Herbihabitans rhizosphaerae]
MKVIIFGATGMVGQGVLRECLRDERVREVLVVGRTKVGREHAKLREITLPDLSELVDRPGAKEELSGYDACFFCLGVSATGVNEEAYRKITYDLTLSVARALSTWNPDLTFVYVSGQGTDSSEKGRLMWARVKGKTENDLLALPMNTYLFRPGYIQPLHGITSKTRLYRALYRVTVPLYPLLRRLAPHQITTTEQLGRAMIAVAADGAHRHHLHARQINEAAA